MATEHLENRIDWLDEQRRKNEDIIRRWEERFANLEKEQNRHLDLIQETSTELTRLTSIASKINEFDESLVRHRQEISRQIKDSEEARLQREKALEELRKADNDEFSKRLSSYEKRVVEFDDVTRAIDSRKEEEIRLSRALDGIEKNIQSLESRNEDQARAVIGMEETNKQETRRIADLQTETSELRKKTDSTQGLIDNATDRIRRLEVELTRISSEEAERKQTLSLWTENQSAKIVEFEREWKGWNERFENFEGIAKDLEERMIQYEDTYRGLKQLRVELDDVLERLERRITEVSEMQRLAEDRFKQEWAAFQADDQKRWNTSRLSQDEQWREHSRNHEKIDEKISKAEGQIAQTAEELEQARSNSAKRVADLAAMVSAWASDVEKKMGSVK